MIKDNFTYSEITDLIIKAFYNIKVLTSEFKYHNKS